MAEYSFLVRETLERDRIYKVDANSEQEARDLLDGFKQKPIEQAACTENIVIDDYYIKDCFRSRPNIGDAVKYKDEIGVLKSIKGMWILETENYALTIKPVEYEWSEEGKYWQPIV